jgi:exopolysaccharide biosynthesis polyprenyl glycosylphosphotransferase
MFRSALNLKRLLLIGGDIVAFQFALLATLWLRYGGVDSVTWNQHAVPFWWITGLWVVGLFVAGLYDLGKTRNGLAFFRSFLEGMIVNLFVAFAFFYLIPFGIAPRANLLLYFAIALLFAYLWRLVFNRYSMSGVFRNRLLFIGSAEDALSVRDLVNSNTFGFTLAAVIHTTPRGSGEPGAIRWESDISKLDSLLVEEQIDGVVVGRNTHDVPGVRDALYRTLFSSVTLIDWRDLEETVTGRVPLAYVDKAWFLEHLRESEKAWFESAKRVGDIILAIPFGILTAVLAPFVGFGIAVTSPGPILIRQTRVGRHGKPFELIKFRSMIRDAEANGVQFTSIKDPRITPFGRFLRITRIDELPQVWNVIRGDMSFVGPRPERPEFTSQLTERMPYYTLRHLTRPGLTGWAQTQYKYASSLDDNLVKLQYDLYYVKHRSLVLDAAILLKTIGIVLRRQGT